MPNTSHIVLPDSLYFTIFFIFGGGLYILLLLPFTLRQKQLMAAPLVAGLFVAPLVFSATNSPALQFVHLTACACVLMRQIDLYYVRPWRTGKEPTFNLEDWWTETWQPFRKIPMSKGQLQRYELELQQERLQQESSSSSEKTKTSESNNAKPVKQLYTPRIDPNPKHWSAYLPRWLFYAMFMEIISFCMSFITYERIQTLSVLSSLAFTTAVGAMIIFDISLINYTIMIIWGAATGNLIHDTEWTLVRHYFPGFATSPSEFWRQWHHLFQYIWVDLGFKPVYHVLHKHVTPKISNRKLAKDIEMIFPVMGVFLMSGLMHEYIIRGMWHARLGGMTSFFLLQGAGTIVSKIIYDIVGRKVTVPSVILIALTWVFNLTTASLFLDPVLKYEAHNLMTLPEEVIMTDSGNDSESGNSSSAGNVSSPFASLTAGGRLAKLLAREKELIATLEQLTRDIESLENPGQDETKADGEGAGEDEVGEDDADDLEEFEAPEWCVPIKANVMTYDWDSLAAECQFDVILMDPPWQLATHAPTRGVAIAYQQLPDICIEELPVPKLSSNGFIFIWVINNKYAKAFDLMRRWGYRYVDDITWVKQTVNRRMAKGHGYYLQHAKETCLVGKKGEDPPGCRHSIGSDVIFSERRGQSQKPEELYELIEELVPNGRYLEIFGRKNNLRDYWVTVGNEL
ncbi:hypothetical protein BGZ79_000067 [Entomortierella chlamydospora]|nr:hypothetical protein BGZ79_000067 [Entomortierella chlamydospora]